MSNTRVVQKGLSSLSWAMVTVVCTGGEVPPSSLSLDWLNASHKIIAADGGLAFLKLLGRRADLWIGDGDSLQGSLTDWAPWFTEAKVLERAKDETDTEAAVRAAVDTGAGEIWLLGGGGGRMDHWLANVRLMACYPTVTRWLTRFETIEVLDSGKSLSLKEGVVSIFPLGGGPWKISSEGLRWPVDQVDFARWHSLSNEVSARGARVEAKKGRFLVLRPDLQGEPQ